MKQEDVNYVTKISGAISAKIQRIGLKLSRTIAFRTNFNLEQVILTKKVTCWVT